jgi:hypothetical protein
MMRRSIIVVLVLVGVGTGAAWITNVTIGRAWDWTLKPTRQFSICTHDRRVGVVCGVMLDQDQPGIDVIVQIGDWYGFRWMACRSYTGPGFTVPNAPTYYKAWVLEVSLAYISALALSYPITIFVRGTVRRYRRQRQGCCLKCGYNLTGNVSGTCPECGRKLPLLDDERAAL